MHEITMKITAPSVGHLEQAISMGMLTSTFLNAASGDLDSVELLHEEGNILVEKFDIQELRELINNYPDAYEGACPDCLSYYKLDEKDHKICSTCAAGKAYIWLENVKSIINGGVRTQ